jgi:glycyl-tRNA synthetase beta chain
VRPLSGIVAILGEELVECEVGGVLSSGYATKGHRFHHPGEITIGSAPTMQDKLRACHVIVDHEERQNLIRSRAAPRPRRRATLVEDEGLVIENAGLTEWPVPLLGRFDEAFLEVPPEVIQLTARTNQKYFVCEDQAASLPTPSSAPPISRPLDGGAGHRRGQPQGARRAAVRCALLLGAGPQEDRWPSTPKKLARITFHEKLGTVADKVERVAKLARWLVEEGIVGLLPGAGGGLPSKGWTRVERSACDPPLRQDDEREESGRSRRTGRALCKADLVTEMVGEFPELQGLMGGYYARAEGLPDAVADAIRDHYKPVGQGDDVPTAPVTVAVSWRTSWIRWSAG